MRTIRFRGLNYPTKEWKYGYLVVHARDVQIWVDGDFPVPVDPKTVGQMTGLKDKNGKEIYEGDIVRFKFEQYYPQTGKSQLIDIIDRVAYCVTSFGYANYSTSIFRADSEPEVIGNIHENPELLESS